MSGNIFEGEGASSCRSPPSKRQKVLSRACEYCKSKKLKCDSTQPRCATCEKKDINCVYKEKGQPGLRPGYGKDVERRLTQLEENYERLDYNLRNAIAQGQVTSTISEPVPSMNEQAPLTSEMRPGDEWPELQPLGFPAGNEGSSGPLQTAPTPDMLLELTELFFEYIHPWAPLFHKPTFMAKLLSTDREILLHGIVVVALRYYKQSAISGEMRDTYLKSSRERIHLHCVDNCSITSTQALALLAIDALADGPGTRIWMLMAMLAAAVQQLGLAKEAPAQHTENTQPMVGNEVPDSGAEASSIAAEEKRRLFWLIFSLDRFASVALGQAGGISTKLIRLRFPSADDNWHQSLMAEWYQPAVPIRSSLTGNAWVHYIEILTLLDRSNRLLIHPFDLTLPAHCQEWQSNFRMLNLTLTTWLETAPEPIRRPTEFDPMWTTIRATYEL